MKRIPPELAFKFLGSGLVLVFFGMVSLSGILEEIKKFGFIPLVWIWLVFSTGFLVAGLAMVIGGSRNIGANLTVAELRLFCDKRPVGYTDRVREIGERLHARGGLEMMIRIHLSLVRVAPGPFAAGKVASLWEGIGGWNGGTEPLAPARGEEAPLHSAPAPIGDESSIVQELMEIYSAHPQGFVLPRVAASYPVEAAAAGPSAQAARIRELGQALNARGGMSPMLRVHSDFARQGTHIFGAARNLEIMWNGIGEWLG